MKYIEGFRDPAAAAALKSEIETLAASPELAGRKVSMMEVCGSHTMAIARFGLRTILPPNVDLISGPGCPVCVTPTGYVDTAVALARGGAVIVTFGDMINVPGSDTTLARCRSAGGTVEVCYSPMAALDAARKHPDREVVFLAIGFETTTGPVVSIVDAAIRDGLGNVSLLVAFKVIPPALAVLVGDPSIRVDGFICPAHVSAIIGSDAYKPLAQAGKACAVAGFEPLDILLAVRSILRQLKAGRPEVDNLYARVVRPGGNAKARALIDKYLEPAPALWRGLGVLPGSGLELRPEFSRYDALRRRGMRMAVGTEPAGCLCGAVISGKCHPDKCPMFGAGCTPDHPVGPCMVSSEGTCAAYYKYSIARHA